MSDTNINEVTGSRGDTHYSHNTHSFNHTYSFYNSFGVTDERSEILSWLSPVEPRIRHQNIRTSRADNVGTWLLEADEFQRWCDSPREDGSEHAALLCWGDPAVGKTYFSSLVIDKLCDEAEENDAAVACFYVDFAAREEQSPINILGSLLKQIVRGLEKIPEEIACAFQRHTKVIGGRGLRVPEISKMLQAVTSLRRTFICVDALDECMEAHRHEILDSLSQILLESPKTRIFLTGRRHIRSEIDRHLVGRVATLRVKPSHDDIVGYIRMRLRKDTSLDAMDSSLEAEIVNTIAENIPETFLLVSLTVDAILGEPTAHGRRQKLRAMTDGLDLGDVYGATIERIKQQGGERTRLGMAALMWISHSERPLQLDELLHALGVRIGSTDLDAETIPSVETLLSCCLGLVVVDIEASAVRLIHFTLQEYLYTRRDLFGTTHSIMAETCLTYLNFQTIKEISPTLLAPPQSATFLKYSSLYWGAHSRRGASRDVISLALKLFNQIEGHISTKLLFMDLISRTGRYKGDIPTYGPLIGFSGLHCASVFGIVEIATSLVGQRNSDLNKRDFLGNTPLVWAAICGQEGIVKLLLEHQTVTPDKPDNYFRRTALAWAAKKGHDGIVRLLLGRASTKPDGTDGWWGKTPQVVNTALGRRYVNPNSPDKYGQTPISLAAEEGHEGVVKLLLGRKDVKPDTTDGYGCTPVFWASSKGYEGVVKLLLGREDVKFDIRDKNGQTLLLSGIENGCEGVVKLLLGRKDTNPNTPDEDGKTPLLLASEKGHEALVKLLLQRGDVETNIPNKTGRTPLWSAFSKGHDGVVKLLLGREDINVNMRNHRGQTPLTWAIVNRHDEVVKLLIGRRNVKLNMVDYHDRTPLHWAARDGHDEIVKLLLEQGDVSPDILDIFGRTPLSWAAGSGHDGVVKLLLEREDVNPNMPDNLTCRAPLLWAALNGHDRVVKLLLGREDVTPDRPDRYNRTPLLLAAGNGHDAVVKLLLEREDINFDIPDNFG